MVKRYVPLIRPWVIAGLIACACVRSARADVTSDRIVAHLRKQLTWQTVYDPAYVRLKYPGGDVPQNRGVCTDVVIRAMRSTGHDLQVLVQQDIKAAKRAYEKVGLVRADANIDHRRCPNLKVFFARHGTTVTTSVKNSTMWKPGDVVFWKLPGGRDHVGVLTDRRNSAGLPWVVHNLAQPTEEDVLTAYRITDHFRFPKRVEKAERVP